MQATHLSGVASEGRSPTEWSVGHRHVVLPLLRRFRPRPSNPSLGLLDAEAERDDAAVDGAGVESSTCRVDGE